MRYSWFVKIRLHWCLLCKEGCVIETHNVALRLFCLAAEKEKQVFSLSRTLTRTLQSSAVCVAALQEQP